jgi:hypothetical protein
MCRCLPGRNQARARGPLYKRHHQKSAATRVPQHEIPLLVERVIWIWHQKRKGISKDCGCLLKSDTVFPHVGLSLLWIPLEYIAHANASQQPSSYLTSSIFTLFMTTGFSG